MDSPPVTGQSQPWINWTTIAIFTVTFLLFLHVFKARRQHGLPPGPFVFPLIGNIPSLLSTDVLGKLRSLRQMYGDVYSLYIGQELSVFLNGYEAVHEALIKKGALFMLRPDTPFHRIVVESPGIVFGNGSRWKQLRVFGQKSLLEFGLGNSALPIEKRINREVGVLLDRIEKIAEPFDPKDVLASSVSRVVVGIFLGKHIDYEDENFLKLLHMVDERHKAVGVSIFLLNAFPFLRVLEYVQDLLKLKRIKEITHEVHSFCGGIYQEHLTTFNDDNIRDFVDQYIREGIRIQQEGTESTFDASTFACIFDDMLGAGTETTSTTLLWLLLFLIKYPTLQSKLHKEVDDTIGSTKVPSLNDRSQLPFVEATIMETLRYANITPLALPHSVPHDITFQGYLIPKNTNVLLNLNSVFMDDKTWGDPFHFRPERFITEDGELFVPKEFIPFSLGRRSCLGESLARMELFLFFTSIIQRFEVRSPEGEPPPDCRGELKLTFTPKPFRVSLVNRSSV